jgi:hypothetical protein
MRQRWVRSVILGLSGVALAGTMVLAPTGAQAATGTGAAPGVVKVNPGKPGKPGDPGKPGNDNPCLEGEKPPGKPGDKTKPGDTTKPGDKAKAGDQAKADEKAKAEKAEAGGKAKGKPGDNGKSKGVLVCGDIAKTNAKKWPTVLVIKTVKGPVTVLVTRDTEITKGDAKQSRKALKVGTPVAVKGELSKSGTVTALGILLL